VTEMVQVCLTKDQHNPPQTRDGILGACLAMDRTEPTQNLKKKFSKLTPIFLLYISHQLLFIPIQIKKITTKQKISFFYTKHSYFFLRINQICYCTSPLSQVQSIAKHSLGSLTELLNPTEKLDKSPLSTKVDNNLLKASMTTTNSRGDRGSSFLKP
jgi:hypothetical protein